MRAKSLPRQPALQAGQKMFAKPLQHGKAMKFARRRFRPRRSDHSNITGIHNLSVCACLPADEKRSTGEKSIRMQKHTVLALSQAPKKHNSRSTENADKTLDRSAWPRRSSESNILLSACLPAWAVWSLVCRFWDAHVAPNATFFDVLALSRSLAPQRKSAEISGL